MLPPSQGDLKLAAIRFSELVNVRNGIAHGKPGTAKDGTQRLFRDGKEISIEALGQASDNFVECGESLNHIFNKYLHDMS